MELQLLYVKNKAFKEYVDKYSNQHCVPPEEALRHAVVKEYAKYAKEI